MPNSPKTPSKTDTFADELEEYDLLGSEKGPAQPQDLATDLSRTAKAFNSKIQRQKKVQAVQSEAAEKAARTRHMLMLRALMNIRKSLRDLTRVDLGESYKLCLSADDWAGWPRLTIRLQDRLEIGKEYQPFIVTAHDRYDAGTIEIAYSDKNPAERLSVARDVDVKRLPNLLRKCVRTYLDYVGEIVLRTERRRDSAIAASERALEGKQLGEFSDGTAKEEAPAIDGDLFSESYQEDLLETLPTMEKVDGLPEVGPGKGEP